MSVTSQDVKPPLTGFSNSAASNLGYIPPLPLAISRISPPTITNAIATSVSTISAVGRSPPQASTADSLFHQHHHHPYRRHGMTSSPSSHVTSSLAAAAAVGKISGVPCPATPTRYTAPVHIDVGGTIYTSSLETLTRFPDSRLAKMFNGNIPIILDSLKQHYFIDRDGKIFRHILNYLRSQRLALPESFRDWDLLLEEARYYEISPMITDIEKLRGMSGNDTTFSAEHMNKPRIKIEEGIEDMVECIMLHISPELGERVSLSAAHAQIQDLFPELSGALMDSRNSGWTQASDFVLRFPLNGFCKLNSLQVMQRLLASGFSVVGCTGGGVEGQQFSEYLFVRRKQTNT